MTGAVSPIRDDDLRTAPGGRVPDSRVRERGRPGLAAVAVLVVALVIGSLGNSEQSLAYGDWAALLVYSAPLAALVAVITRAASPRMAREGLVIRSCIAALAGIALGFMWTFALYLSGVATCWVLTSRRCIAGSGGRRRDSPLEYYRRPAADWPRGS